MADDRSWFRCSIDGPTARLAAPRIVVFDQSHQLAGKYVMEMVELRGPLHNFHARTQVQAGQVAALED
jgi:hypothetical protein